MSDNRNRSSSAGSESSAKSVQKPAWKRHALRNSMKRVVTVPRTPTGSNSNSQATQSKKVD